MTISSLSLPAQPTGPVATHSESSPLTSEPHGTVQRIFNVQESLKSDAEFDCKNRIEAEMLKLEHIQKHNEEFVQKTCHLKLVDGQQLRLKGDRIKPARYCGPNPFKHVLQTIGARSSVYDKQVDALRTRYNLHCLSHLDHRAISEHFKSRAKGKETLLEQLDKELDHIKIVRLREDLSTLQIEAKKHAASHPALQALVIDTAEKKQTLNRKANELRTSLFSYRAKLSHKKEQLRQQPSHAALLGEIDRIRCSMTDAEVNLTNVTVEAKLVAQFHGKLHVLSENIASTQQEIYRLSKTSISAATLPVNLDTFMATWQTTPGRKAMQMSIKHAVDVPIDSAAIARDLVRKHQNAGASFSLSPTQQSQIDHVATQLSSHAVIDEQCRQIYLDTLNRYEDGPGLEPYRRLTYRTNALTQKDVDSFAELMAQEELFSFPEMLDTYDDLLESDCPHANVIFEIHGSSMKRAYSTLLPGTEAYTPSNAFTPFAAFKVEHMERGTNDKLVIRLVEYLMNPDLETPHWRMDQTR